MRYIITESRLESLVFKYLDTKLKGIKKKKGRYLDTVFVFPGEEHGVIAHNFTDDLYILTDLVKDVMTMFSVDVDTARDFFGKYFESKYNLRVERTPVIPYSTWAEFKIKKP
jgi:hypothetical protein